jgi:hypothetical protein
VDRCQCCDVPSRHGDYPSGHVEQLPSGSWRAKVYAGKDPLTGREIRFRRTCKTGAEQGQVRAENARSLANALAAETGRLEAANARSEEWSARTASTAAPWAATARRGSTGTAEHGGLVAGREPQLEQPRPGISEAQTEPELAAS